MMVIGFRVIGLGRLGEARKTCFRFGKESNSNCQGHLLAALYSP